MGIVKCLVSAAIGGLMTKAYIAANKCTTKEIIHIDDGCAKFKDGVIIRDSEVADYALRHMDILDRLDPYKVASAALYSFAILSPNNDGYKPPENFKFEFKK